MPTVQLTTADQFLGMGRDVPRELVRGEVRMMAPSGFDHGAIINNLAYLLTAAVKRAALGVVVGAETGFRLAHDPDTVRGAGVAFVKASRIPAEGRPTGYFEGAPDLAVEVLSPHDSAEGIQEKVDQYLAAGSTAVWVVNPRRRTLTIHRMHKSPLTLSALDVLDGGELLPGFSCLVADLFL